MTIENKLTLLCTHIVQLRDCNEKCIICKNTIHQFQAAHLIKSSKSKLLKWVLFNFHGACESCNQKEESDKTGKIHAQFEVNLADRIGMNVVMTLNASKNKTSHFSNKDKEEMFAELKQIFSDLKRGDYSSYEKYCETKLDELCNL